MLARHQFGQLGALRPRGAQAFDILSALQILTNRDVFHFRRDHAATGVMHLRHIHAGFGPARLALQVEAQFRELGIKQALYAELRCRPGQRLGIAALLYPFGAQRRQAVADVDLCVRIGIGPGGIVDIDGRVRLCAEGSRRVVLADRAHRHPDVGPAALHIDLARVRQRLHRCVVHMRGRGDEFRVGVHGSLLVTAGAKAGGRSAHASLRRHYPHQVLRDSLTRAAVFSSARRTPNVRKPRYRNRPRFAIAAPCRGGVKVCDRGHKTAVQRMVKFGLVK